MRRNSMAFFGLGQNIEKRHEWQTHTRSQEMPQYFSPCELYSASAFRPRGMDDLNRSPDEGIALTKFNGTLVDNCCVPAFSRDRQDVVRYCNWRPDGKRSEDWDLDRIGCDPLGHTDNTAFLLFASSKAGAAQRGGYCSGRRHPRATAHRRRS